MQLEAAKFLRPATLGIIAIGLAAFALGTAGGVLFAKLMNVFSRRNPINPLIGSAGVSAFPMAARVSTRLALEALNAACLDLDRLAWEYGGEMESLTPGEISAAQPESA